MVAPFNPVQRAYGPGVGTTTTTSYWVDVRDPTANDTKGPTGIWTIGTWWFNTTGTGTVWFLRAFTSAGAVLQASWESTHGGTDDFAITPYVVGPVGEAGYLTIQAALDAANTAGGGIVVVQPGTYTENLTTYDNTQVVGAIGLGDTGDFIIVGVHTPPTSGGFSFRNINLQSATDVFSSTAVGTATLIVIDCLTTLTSGYVFDCLNWTGSFVLFDIGDTSTDNGVVNNTGGASLVFDSASCGQGTGNSMVVSGSFASSQFECNCPIDFQTGSVIAADSSIFLRTVTLSNDSTGGFSLSRFSTGATAAIAMNSSGAVALSNLVIDSTNNPAIDGTGAGTLTPTNLSFLNNSAFNSSLTIGGGITFTKDAIISTSLTLGENAKDISFAINGISIDAVVALHTEGATDLAGFASQRHDDVASFGAHNLMVRSRGAEGAPTIVQDDDDLARIIIGGYDGTDYAQSSELRFEVDGTPGNDDMPGRIRLCTSADGTQTPIEAVRIDCAQDTTLSGAMLPIGDRAENIGSATNAWNDVFLDGLSFNDGTDTMAVYISDTAFTPVLEFGGGTTDITYATQTGAYCQVGDLVTFEITIILTNKGSSAGNAAITGLPVAPEQFVAINLRPVVLTFTGVPIAGLSASGDVVLYDVTSGGAETILDEGDFANTTELNIAGSFVINP